MSDSSTDDEKLRSFFTSKLNLVSKIVGGASGVVIAHATGMPIIGAMLSPFVAQSLERAGSEIICRQLAPRQEIRAARAYFVAYEQIRSRTSSGESLRIDGFFDVDPLTGRAIADEVTETALFAAISSTQELKVDYIALY